MTYKAKSEVNYFISVLKLRPRPNVSPNINIIGICVPLTVLYFICTLGSLI